jgi:hypothetical protein
MYIHQDGKTNIIHGDCFDPEVMNAVRAKKPTVGFLNPPYKSNKKKDTDELAFILNNLECLVDGGMGIAIVPMSCAIGNSIGTLAFKKELLKKHTLEAVLSMPGELFFNSNVNEVTCVMVFTAHKPHPQDKETYFGYYKNDGFVKRKINGRTDALNKWAAIKHTWLSNFMNKKAIPGFSVNRSVCYDTEWSAENFMETDYSLLREANFIDTLHGYATFLFGNKLVSEVAEKAFLTEKIKLDIEAWEYCDLTSLFTVKGSTTTSLLDLEEYGRGKYPYVTTQATNNGVAGFFDFFSEDGNVLTVDSAVLGYTAYQPSPFSASDHVEKLIPLFGMNKYSALFIVTIMNGEQFRFNYGRKANQIRIRKMAIKLPIKKGKPDFAFMEAYIKSLPYSGSI